MKPEIKKLQPKLLLAAIVWSTVDYIWIYLSWYFLLIINKKEKQEEYFLPLKDSLW